MEVLSCIGKVRNFKLFRAIDHKLRTNIFLILVMKCTVKNTLLYFMYYWIKNIGYNIFLLPDKFYNCYTQKYIQIPGTYAIMRDLHFYGLLSPICSRFVINNKERSLNANKK